MVNVASAPTPFVGRQDELAQIRSLLSDPTCRLLTLVGSGGIGKTRLAIEAARQSPLASYLVALQPLTSPDFIVSAIANATGFQFYSGSEPKPQLLDFLREKSWLLMLDNFEHLLDGAALLSDMLAAAPELRLLVTSRERLNLVEEWALDIEGLAYPLVQDEANAEGYSAVELFVQHAKQGKVSFALTDIHRPAVVRVCRLVGGMPLAIELAASWVRSLSCAAIADEIEHSLDILETSARNVEPRHRTMRAAFAPTWERLTDHERDVFMKLSVFREGFTREAAKAVAGAPLRTLSALVDKSLLRVAANGRYDVHELLRQYAAEKLQESGQFAVTREAHCSYFVAFMQQKWEPMRTEWKTAMLDEIGLEFDNVRTAWQWMVETRKSAELSVMLHPLWKFAYQRGRSRDAFLMFKQAEDELRPTAGHPAVDRALGMMLGMRGWRAWYGSEASQKENEERAQEGLAILRRVGTPEDVFLALDSLAALSAHAHNLSALKRYSEEMAQIARRINDRWRLANALFPLSNAAANADDLEMATQRSQEFLEAAEACGDLEWISKSFGVVQLEIAWRRGDYVEARRCCQRALELFEETGQADMSGEMHCELGRIAVFLNDYPLAARHFREGLQILLDVGYTVGVMHTLTGVAQLWIALGYKARAAELLVLILKRRDTMQKIRGEAEEFLRRLAIELPPDTFAIAQARGHRLELSVVTKALLAEFSELAQAPALVISASASPSLDDPLTARELEILPLIAEGLTNREIADQLFLTQNTIKWYVRRMFSKLDAASRIEAVAHARRIGLLS